MEDGSIVRERRGISWRDQTLDSISAPPLSLLLFFGLLIMLMYLNTLNEVTEKVERKRAGLRLRLLLLPVAVILVIILNMLRRRMMEYDVIGVPVRHVAEEWSSASGLLLVLLLVLVMVYYKSSSQSAWFRIF